METVMRDLRMSAKRVDFQSPTHRVMLLPCNPQRLLAPDASLDGMS
jgi:hypothetical protein